MCVLFARWCFTPCEYLYNVLVLLLSCRIWHTYLKVKRLPGNIILLWGLIGCIQVWITLWLVVSFSPPSHQNEAKSWDISAIVEKQRVTMGNRSEMLQKEKSRLCTSKADCGGYHIPYPKKGGYINDLSFKGGRTSRVQIYDICTYNYVTCTVQVYKQQYMTSVWFGVPMDIYGLYMFITVMWLQ